MKRQLQKDVKEARVEKIKRPYRKKGFPEVQSSATAINETHLPIIPNFQSCLTMAAEDKSSASFDEDAVLVPSPGVGSMLQRSLSIRELEDSSWLSSSLIDLALSKFAQHYSGIHFLPIDFVIFMLSTTVEDMKKVTDITGKVINTNQRKPIVFICNNQNIHWNTIRVQFEPSPEIQLFEVTILYDL